MSLALLFHYLMLNMFQMMVHPSSGACDLFVELFHGLCCCGSMCVGVTVWFGWGGVVFFISKNFYYYKMCKFLLQISKHDNQDITSLELFKQHGYLELTLIMFSAFNELNFS